MTKEHQMNLGPTKSEAEMVLTGRDGFLFLQNDANRVIDQIEGRFPIGSNDLYTTATVHASRRLFLQTVCDAQYCHILIPNKEVVFADHLPSSVVFERDGPRPYSRYRQIGASRLWNPFYQPDTLQAPPRQSFPRTDTHWNHHGAIDYLTAFLDVAVPQMANSLRRIPMREFGSEQLGDLGGKVGLPKEPITIVAPSSPSASLTFDNRISNEGRVRYFENSRIALRRRAVLLHDSFGEWLLPTIAELFSDLICLHGSDVDLEFIAKFDPDHVWFFQVERFFVRVPRNGVNWLENISEQEQRKNSTVQFSSFIKERGLLKKR
jgi:hypothetical protein